MLLSAFLPHPVKVNQLNMTLGGRWGCTGFAKSSFSLVVLKYLNIPHQDFSLHWNIRLPLLQRCRLSGPNPFSVNLFIAFAVMVSWLCLCSVLALAVQLFNVQHHVSCFLLYLSLCSSASAVAPLSVSILSRQAVSQ